MSDQHINQNLMPEHELPELRHDLNVPNNVVLPNGDVSDPELPLSDNDGISDLENETDSESSASESESVVAFEPRRLPVLPCRPQIRAPESDSEDDEVELPARPRAPIPGMAPRPGMRQRSVLGLFMDLMSSSDEEREFYEQWNRVLTMERDGNDHVLEAERHFFERNN